MDTDQTFVKSSLDQRRLTTEQALYFLAFCLALALRLFRLGASPLTDAEANWALQALNLARGTGSALGPQPAYLVATGLFFWVFKETNALARFFPAIAGSLLVFLPLLVHHKLFSSHRLRLAGILLAFGLALDPGLVALSLVAGSLMGALSFSLLAVGAFYTRKPRLVGILGGLALLSGPALLQGLFGFSLAWLAARVLEGAGLGKHLHFFESMPDSPESAFAWKPALVFGAGTVLLGGTLVLLVPQGLGALTASLPAYLAGWTHASGIPALRLPAALLVYQALPVIAGLLGAVVAWFRLSEADPVRQMARFFSLWFLLSVFLAMVIPGRQVSDIAWALVPLWSLAAIALSSQLIPEPMDSHLPVALVYAGVNVLFLVIAWHNLLRLKTLDTNGAMYIGISAGILLMLLVVAVLVTVGFSLSTTLTGLTWGGGAFLAVYLFFCTWSASQVRPNATAELWSVGPASGQVKELITTLTDLSNWKTGQRYDLDIAVTLDSSSLRWALRNFRNARYLETVPPGELPSVILTGSDAVLPGLSAAYRGQDLVLRELAGWSGVLPGDLLGWITYRKASATQEKLILWARSDLFPGASQAP